MGKLNFPSYQRVSPLGTKMKDEKKKKEREQKFPIYFDSTS
jgi:hypothetical protein